MASGSRSRVSSQPLDLRQLLLLLLFLLSFIFFLLLSFILFLLLSFFLFFLLLLCLLREAE